MLQQELINRLLLEKDSLILNHLHLRHHQSFRLKHHRQLQDN
jgi:hypothetical protein